MFRTFLAFLFLLLPASHVLSQEAGANPQRPAASGSGSATDPTQNSSDSSSKKEKKVWTNENLGDAKGTVSVVGGKDAAKAKGHPTKPADAAYVASVKSKLEKMRGDIASADKQIAKLREFNAGEPVGTSEREFHKGYNMQPIDQQIQRLEEKKRDLQAKIDALLDEARKKGVEPGQLR